jgi:hypothetical protein
VNDPLFIRHIETEVTVRIVLHFIWRKTHQIAAHMVEIAHLEFDVPERRVPVDAAQQFMKRNHAFLSRLIKTIAMLPPLARRL